MDLNSYIKKSHLKAIDKFNEELRAWAEETGEYPPTLYEDAFTPFTLWNIRVVNGVLLWDCDGKTEDCKVVLYDDEENEYYEDDWMDGIPQSIKYWKSCLRKAKKYWEMSPERLDAIYDFEAEDIQDNEEE